MVSRQQARPSRQARILAPLITQLENQGLSGNAALQTLRATLRRDPFRDQATGTLITGIRTQEFFRVFTPQRRSSVFSEGVNVLSRRQIPDVLGFAISPFRQKTRFLHRVSGRVRIKTTGETFLRFTSVGSDSPRNLEEIVRAAAGQLARNPIDSEVDIDSITIVDSFISAPGAST